MNWAPVLDLPVPGDPETRILLPRKYPLPPSISSSARNAGGNPPVRGRVVESERSDRQHREPLIADQERILVGAVERAPVFDDPQPASRNLLGDPVVEKNDAVGDVFFESVPGQRIVTPFPGDDGGEAAVFEPAEESAQLGPKDGVIWKPGEQRLQGIEHDPLGADGVDRVPEPDEQSIQVVLPAFLDFAALDPHMVEDDLFLCATSRSRSKPRERTFCGQLLGILLEHHEDTGLPELGRAPHDELHREHRLPAPRRSAHQGGPTGGKARPR